MRFSSLAGNIEHFLDEFLIAGSHIVCQDDKLRRLAVIMRTETYDKDLSDNGAQNTGKPAASHTCLFTAVHWRLSRAFVLVQTGEGYGLRNDWSQRLACFLQDTVRCYRKPDS
jgi:hypothetical protein